MENTLRRVLTPPLWSVGRQRRVLERIGSHGVENKRNRTYLMSPPSEDTADTKF